VSSRRSGMRCWEAKAVNHTFRPSFSRLREGACIKLEKLTYKAAFPAVTAQQWLLARLCLARYSS
jgi:hypothetical protein